MKNKKIIKSGLISFAICSIGLSFTSAATHFSLNLKWLEELTPKVITDKMMYVHFADNWNDFGWFLYFSNNLSNEDESESNYEIGTDAEDNNAEYVCRKQVKWFYYNSERGERLWPLDDETRDLFYWGEWLDLTWWIYTNCAWAWYQEALKDCEQDDQYQSCIAEVNNRFKSDEYGYYGELAHTYSWQEMKLVMWVNYNTGTDFISIQPLSKLAPTFIRLQNKYPVGFVYDYNGWLGLAGCKFESESLEDDSMKKLVNEVTDDGSVNLTNVFTTTKSGTIEYIWTNAKINCEPISEEDSLMRIIFEWVLWVSNSWTTWALDFGTMGNSSDKKMQYFATKTINNATMMNYAKKRAESLCRWKWKTTPPPNPAQITCLDLPKDQDKSIIDATNFDGKTLIVKWGNVKVKSDIDKKYDIFIDGWNLLIEESKKEEKTISGHTVSWYDNLYFIENNWSYTSDSWPSFKSCAGKNIFTCIYLIIQKMARKDQWNYDLNNDAQTNISDIIRIRNCIAGTNKNCRWNIAWVLKWNFIVNGKVKVYPEQQEKLWHKYFIYWKFVTKDSIIDLENMFWWRCINWYTSDGYICDKEGNPYRNASLVVIDQNYKSPVLGS